MNFLNRHIILLAVTGLLTFATACSSQLHISELTHHYYEISDEKSAHQEMEAFLLPYKTAMEAEMNEVVGYVAENMPRSQPESLLGNFVADLILEQGKIYHGGHIDASIVNIGGLRVPNLAEGELTKGHVFELMPFDNFLVVMEVSGAIIEKISTVIGEFSGWPVSGMTLVLDDGQPEQIKIGGKPLNREEKYTIVLSDFLADGGDRLSFLVDMPRKNLGILFRDAIFDYLERLSGEPVHSQLDGRVKYAE